MVTRWVSVITLLGVASICLGQGLIQYDDSNRCTNPRGVQGICINIRKCEPLLLILRNQRQRPGATEFLRKSVCGYSGLDPLVCCPQESSQANQTPAPPDNPQFNIGKYSALPVSQDCGFSNISHTRVVGGNPAILDAWPWMAALGYRPSARSSSKAPRFLCGGSLITRRHVLTAAHCVYNRGDLYFVRLGELDLQSDRDGANPIEIGISNKKVHENYSPTQFTNDIAILTLEEEIRPTISIHPICLPTPDYLISKDFLNTTPFIAGWGAQNFSGPSSSELLELQIPTVDLPKCKKAFSRFKSAVIDERVLCAGFEEGGKDACQGDSGGPLMWPDPKQKFVIYYQIGVVSYGYRCAEPGIPGVYTRVTYFLDWINNNVK